MSSVQLLCADVCPEVLPIAQADHTILTDVRVLAHLLQLECSFLPEIDYFASDSPQTELQPYMRRVVTTWMLEVTEEQKCEEQIFPLAVNLLDRFLSVSPVQRCQLQLLGCVCLLTATKLRQCRPIAIDLLVYYTDYSVTAHEIRVWEMLLLAKLHWDVSSVTAFDFVDQLMEKLPICRRRPAFVKGKSLLELKHSTRSNNNSNVQTVRGHALTYVSLCCTETEYMRIRPSLIAAASLSAALNGLGLASKSSSSEHEILAHLVQADLEEFTRLVRSIERLMASQLASVQQQQQQNSLQNNSNSPYQMQQYKSKQPSSSSSSAAWEDVQPETPTDIQEIHF